MRGSSCSTSHPRCSATPSCRACSAVMRRLAAEGRRVHLHLASAQRGVPDHRPRDGDEGRAGRGHRARPASWTPTDLVRLMVGRDLGDYVLRRAPADRPGRGRAGGARAHAPAGVLRRHRSRGARGRDPGHRRAGGLGPHGGAAGDPRRRSRSTAGEVEVFGSRSGSRSPRHAIALGIGLLTEDRKADGLLLLQSVAVNMTITRLGAIAPRGVIRRGRERARRRGLHRPAVDPDAQHPDTRVRNLSGGNQQKVIFAKWLHAECRILLIDEPTRGVDVGAKREIYHLLASSPRGAWPSSMVSSELPEILAHQRPHPGHARGPHRPPSSRAPTRPRSGSCTTARARPPDEPATLPDGLRPGPRRRAARRSSTGRTWS